jgi:hypothetical protein
VTTRLTRLRTGLRTRLKARLRTRRRALGATTAILVLVIVAASAGARPGADPPAGIIWDTASHPDTATPAPPSTHPPGRSHVVPAPEAPDLPDDLPDDLPSAVTGEFTGWAIMDLASGAVTGSGNADQLSTTASMIKVWLVADYLRLAGALPDDPELIDDLRQIVRDSDNPLAHDLFAELGGEESIDRLVDVCDLTDAEATPLLWSNTRLSPRDTARMGACLADGRAAGGPIRTRWLLDEMRDVNPPGDFGIREAFPPGTHHAIAVKNGWVIRDAVDEWHVSCLAVGDTWSMGVLTRYPAALGVEHGAEICRTLASTHLRTGEPQPH